MTEMISVGSDAGSSDQAIRRAAGGRVATIELALEGRHGSGKGVVLDEQQEYGGADAARDSCSTREPDDQSGSNEGK